MNEQEWLTSEDPARMLEWRLDHHQHQEPPTAGCGEVSDRKLRLFVMALVQSNPIHDASIRGRFERWLERGLKTPESQDTGIQQARIQIKCYEDSGQACDLLREIVGNPFQPPINEVNVWLGRWLFHQTVLSLAQAAYEDRLADGTLDPHRLAVLSDALEEAGCSDETILRHLRGWGQCRYGNGYSHDSCEGCDKSGWNPLPGPHVRGCWVLDLVLGKD